MSREPQKPIGFEDYIGFGRYANKKVVSIMANDIKYLRFLKATGTIFDEKVNKCLKCIKDETKK